jgi:hypothetical protein
MKKYTVVLLYPRWATEFYGEDTFTAHVEIPEGRSSVRALEAAQEQAFDAWLQDPDMEDWELKEIFEQGGCAQSFFALVAFEGHHDPVDWGWRWK